MQLSELLEKARQTTVINDDDQKIIEVLKKYSAFADYIINSNQLETYKKLSNLTCHLFTNRCFQPSVLVCTAALKLTIIFGDYQAAIRYLKEIHGHFNSLQKLFGHVINLETPPDPHHYSISTWQTLSKKYMTSRRFEDILPLADKIEKFVREQTTTFDDEKTIPFSEKTSLNTLFNYAACTFYQCSLARANVAKVFFTYRMPHSQFQRYLTLQPLDNNEHIPPIKIDGATIGYPHISIEKLNPFDPTAALLGQMTGCCQYIGNISGEAATLHGIENSRGGFYVIRLKKENKIISQCWAWRGKNQALVFDSIESQIQYRERRSDENAQMIAECFGHLAYMLVKHHHVPRVLLGTGGATPVRLVETYDPEPETICDFSGYQDSQTQSLLSANSPLEKAYLNQFALYAINVSDDNLLESALKRGANVEVKNRLNTSLLHHAVAWSNKSKVALLRKYGAALTTKDEYGWTAPTLAIKNQDFAILSLLFAHGNYPTSPLNSFLDTDGITLVNLKKVFYILFILDSHHLDSPIKRNHALEYSKQIINKLENPKKIIEFLNELFILDQESHGFFSRKNSSLSTLKNFIWKEKSVSPTWFELLDYAADYITLHNLSGLAANEKQMVQTFLNEVTHAELINQNLFFLPKSAANNNIDLQKEKCFSEQRKLK